jgi:triosephosphate isomerase
MMPDRTPRPRIFAANWKMNVGPDEARAFAARFLAGFTPRLSVRYWFFPAAVSLESTAAAFAGHPAIAVGVQDIHWEPKGAFTGATSAPLARSAGATLALVGHSERRHLFGEAEGDTARKVKASLGSGLTPLLCVGETLAEREAGITEAVVLRQLQAAIADLSPGELAAVVVAYEPVWAIGTGRNATPADASAVHRALRGALSANAHPDPRILYGGSVNDGNAAALLAEPEIDGVLVGGASLDPDGWRRIVDRDPR